jgi:hypothetical protein
MFLSLKRCVYTLLGRPGRRTAWLGCGRRACASSGCWRSWSWACTPRRGGAAAPCGPSYGALIHMIKLEKLQWQVFRIRKFLGLPDPDPDPSINKHNFLKNLDLNSFATSYDLLSMKTDINVPTIGTGNQQKTNLGKKIIFCWHLQSPWKKNQDPDP